MLAANRSFLEILTRLERGVLDAAAQLAALRAQGGGGVVDGLQLTPTTSFWLTDANGKDLMRIVSLANAGVAGWTNKREHWYRWPSFQYPSLTTNGPLTLTMHHSSASESPDNELRDEMTSLKANWTFEMEALGVLDQSDWSTTKPTMPGGYVVHAFKGTSPENNSLRLAFCTDSTGVLKHIVWVASSKFTSIFTSPNGSRTISLSYDGAAIPDPFSPSYYYVATKP